MIRGTICEPVRQSGYFLLMADETKDVSKLEKLSVGVRYIDKEGIVNERFFTFVQATSLNAEILPSYLMKVLEDNELDLACIVRWGICYEWELQWCAAANQRRMPLCHIHSLLCVHSESCTG